MLLTMRDKGQRGDIHVEGGKGREKERERERG